MNIVEIINNLIVQKAYASLGETLDAEINDLQTYADANLVTNAIVRISIPVSVVCVVLLLVYGGYMLMSSKGDPDKLQEAKQIITNAIIGFVVILLCVAVLLLISDALNLNIYN